MKKSKAGVLTLPGSSLTMKPQTRRQFRQQKDRHVDQRAGQRTLTCVVISLDKGPNQWGKDCLFN